MVIDFLQRIPGTPKALQSIFQQLSFVFTSILLPLRLIGRYRVTSLLLNVSTMVPGLTWSGLEEGCSRCSFLKPASGASLGSLHLGSTIIGCISLVGCGAESICASSLGRDISLAGSFASSIVRSISLSGSVAC